MSKVKLRTKRAVVAKVRNARYKLKTSSTISKRFSLTGTGIVVATQSGKRHNMRKRSKRQLNNQTGCVAMHGNTMAKLLVKYGNL
jgi:large subunit ribosomal protein L35